MYGMYGASVCAYKRVTLIRSLSPAQLSAQQCTLLDWAASRIVARLDAPLDALLGAAC